MESTASELNKNRNIRWVAVLCLAGIVLNLIGSAIADELHLPMYLDTIGTILVSVIGGYLPGITVGFVSNFIKAAADQSAVYYECLSVIMAVVAAWFAEKGLLKKIWGVICFIFALALIGGGLGSVLTWFLYGFAQSGISVKTVSRLYESGLFSPFWAQFNGEFLVDLADKVVNAIIVLPFYYFLPDRIREKFELNGWQQKPLKGREEKFLTTDQCLSDPRC